MTQQSTIGPISVEHEGTFYRVSVKDFEPKPEAPFIIMIEDVLTGDQQTLDLKETRRKEATALQDFCIMSWLSEWQNQMSSGVILP